MNVRIVSFVLIGLLVLAPGVLARGGDKVKKERALLGKYTTTKEINGPTKGDLAEKDKEAATSVKEASSPSPAPTVSPVELTAARGKADRESMGPTTRALGQQDSLGPRTTGHENDVNRGNNRGKSVTQSMAKQIPVSNRHPGKTVGYMGKVSGKNSRLTTLGRRRS